MTSSSPTWGCSEATATLSRRLRRVQSSRGGCWGEAARRLLTVAARTAQNRPALAPPRPARRPNPPAAGRGGAGGGLREGSLGAPPRRGLAPDREIELPFLGLCVTPIQPSISARAEAGLSTPGSPKSLLGPKVLQRSPTPDQESLRGWPDDQQREDFSEFNWSPFYRLLS